MVNGKNSDDAAMQEFAALKLASARLGNDPWQVQGAGGNTSIKQADLMWIKASGKWLMHAESEEIFVPVERQPLLEALAKGDPRAEKSVDFVKEVLNPHGLRPSIETTLHAVLQHRVVIHTHCVDTIAIAIRKGAQLQLTELLATFNWVFVPYVRPGLPLSQAIVERLQPDTDVLVLGNHGLVVGADSVTACLELLERVRLQVKQSVRSSRSAITDRQNVDLPELDKLLVDSDYAPAEISQAHELAFNNESLKVAVGGSLYPDHVIFLGEGTVLAQPGETAAELAHRFAINGDPPPTSIVFAGNGVAIKQGATPGQQAMARCLADVCSRVPDDAPVNYFNEEQNHELLNWEAEQYRQKLNQ